MSETNKRATHVADERQSQLKLLIAKGKEQGFLTYGEVNDHLPSEIVDPEQIEDIVNMINDMGIPVYEKAPDAETLILAEGAVATDDEAVEEAAAALATVDAEFGRTTDPVRMYMREMGTVELLTREGEIRIAKRIEEGLDAVRGALAHFPATYELLLKAYEPVKAGQGRLVDIIVGFIDPNAPDEIAQPQNPKLMALEKAETEGDDEEAGDEEEALETGPDPEEAARRFAAIAKLHAQVVKALDEKGPKDPKTEKARDKLAAQFMELKLAPKMFDLLIGNLREYLAVIRGLEKEIMQICVKHAGMPRKDFIAVFPKNETKPGWIDKQIRAKRKHSAPLAKLKPDIVERQGRIRSLEEALHHCGRARGRGKRGAQMREAKTIHASKLVQNATSDCMPCMVGICAPKNNRPPQSRMRYTPCMPACMPAGQAGASAAPQRACGMPARAPLLPLHSPSLPNTSTISGSSLWRTSPNSSAGRRWRHERPE